MRSSATNAASEGAANLYQTLCSDPDLAMIFVRGNATPSELNESEMARYFSLLLMTMFKLQNGYFQTRDRFMDDTLLSSWIKVVRPISSLPGFQEPRGRNEKIGSGKQIPSADPRNLTPSSSG